MLRLAGKEEEADISWFDWSCPRELSKDGNLILFDETGQAAGSRYMVYLHDTAKRSTTRLGEGRAMGLSPDGRFALTLGATDRTFLSLVPLAAPGQPRRLPGNGIAYQWARFFPDGRILSGGGAPGKRLHMYVQTDKGDNPISLQPDVYLDNPAVSPDGRQLAGLNGNGKVELLTIGGETRVLPTPPGVQPLRWTADGKFLIVSTWRGSPAKLYRINLSTGEAAFWKAIAPADPVGAVAFHGIRISDDNQTLVYGSLRRLSEIFVAHGWM